MTSRIFKLTMKVLDLALLNPRTTSYNERTWESLQLWCVSSTFIGVYRLVVGHFIYESHSCHSWEPSYNRLSKTGLEVRIGWSTGRSTPYWFTSVIAFDWWVVEWADMSLCEWWVNLLCLVGSSTILNIFRMEYSFILDAHVLSIIDLCSWNH